MIRNLITVLSALKMRNFTRIFPNIFGGAHTPPLTPPSERGGASLPLAPPGKGAFAPPYGISQLRP